MAGAAGLWGCLLTTRSRRAASPPLNSSIRGLNARLSWLAIPLFAACSVTASAVGAWSPLPRTGFVARRAATQADVNSVSAGFAIGGNGVVGSPSSITIPQYAYFNDNDTTIRACLQLQMAWSTSAPSATWTYVTLQFLDSEGFIAALVGRVGFFRPAHIRAQSSSKF